LAGAELGVPEVDGLEDFGFFVGGAEAGAGCGCGSGDMDVGVESAIETSSSAGVGGDFDFPLFSFFAAPTSSPTSLGTSSTDSLFRLFLGATSLSLSLDEETATYQHSLPVESYELRTFRARLLLLGLALLVYVWRSLECHFGGVD
jgi:hypothetical protein